MRGLGSPLEDECVRGVSLAGSLERIYKEAAFLAWVFELNSGRLCTLMYLPWLAQAFVITSSEKHNEVPSEGLSRDLDVGPIPSPRARQTYARSPPKVKWRRSAFAKAGG